MAATRRKALPARSKVQNQLVRAATSPAAKTAYAVVGTVGLAALAIAIFGPKRFQKEILAPVQNRVGDQASQLWTTPSPCVSRSASCSRAPRTAPAGKSWPKGFSRG